MRKIKFSCVFPWFPVFRQTPGGRGIWGNYQFISDPEIEECDAWVVYNNLAGTNPEKAFTSRRRTILALGEPPSSRIHISQGFTSQFATFITCHSQARHPGIYPWQQGLPWWVGLRRLGPRQFECKMGYDELAAMAHIDKTKELSIVCSNLIITPEHRQRVRFVRKLAEHFGNRLELFGEGFRPIQDKWDAIAPFKYHVTLENSSVPDYWTEKLADTFLAGAMPIYYGCPNIGQYFSKDSMVTININNPSAAIDMIEQTLLERRYERALDAIWESRRRVLEEHNLFAMLAKLLDTLPYGDAESIILHPTSHYKPDMFSQLRRLNRLAYEGLARTCFKTFN